MHARLRWSAVAAMALFSWIAVADTGKGFGRFGRLHTDGLSTVQLGPDGAQPPPQVPGWRLGWSAPRNLRVVSLDFTAKVVAGKPGAPDGPSGWVASLLYPGFGLDFAGDRASFRLGDEQGRPEGRWTRRDVTGPDGRVGGVVLWRSDRAAPPLAFLLPPGRTLAAHEVGEDRLALRADGPIGRLRVLTPWGIRRFDPAADDPEALLASVRRWFDRAIPRWTGRTTSADAAGAKVRFEDRFAHAFGPAYAPVPPVLAFALDQGYPARLPDLRRDSDLWTLQGPWAELAGNVARWTLPVPDLSEDALVAAPVPDDHPDRVELNRVPEDLVMAWARNAVDLGYSRSTPALMAWPYLDDDRRARLDALIETHYRAVWTMPEQIGPGRRTPWQIATEPLTGQHYLWTYKIDGEGPWRYDIEWGNALPIYGLAKAAAYRGTVDLARTAWPGVIRADRFIALSQDWAWMTGVNADHGFSTGTGDPLAAAFAGAVGMVRLARLNGDAATETRALARLASMAVPAVARFGYTPWARAHGLIGPRSVVVGFHEREGFTRGVLGADPWDVTTYLSGNGAVPEFTRWLATADPAGLDRYLAEYAEAYPRWWDQTVRYERRGTYDGNSGYVVYPHIFARRHRGAPASAARDWLAGVRGNRMHAWVGSNVIAEVLSDGVPLRLRSWTGAYDAGLYRDGVATLEFITPAEAPRRLELDLTPGAEVRLTTPGTLSRQGARAVVEAPSGAGRWTVGLTFEPGG